MSEERATLARMMPDAFPLFFHGRDPYEGQRQVMPAIVRGQDVLFAAPTASGKTEAAITPLFQRHISFQRRRLSTVYVAPTKALVNDLYERLMGYLGSRFPNAVARYTGDRHEFASADGVFCVLATPEALDSLQLRRPKALANVRAVVIDEIHLLHGQPRGQQLRHVIGRLRGSAMPPRSMRDRFQLIGMTATIDDMEGVARRWLGAGAQVMCNGKPREIELELVPCAPAEDPSPGKARALAGWVRRSGLEKLLVFSNSRNGAHALAACLHQDLSGERWPVHLHFGTLAASERERVEQAMRDRRHGICVATSTLEIGIDIGDVDAVVLADAPPTVGAFLQRIGRGNRRSGVCRVLALCSNEEDERIIRALVDCGARGELDDSFEYERPSVEFQQALSLSWRATRQDRALNLETMNGEVGCDLAQTVGDMLDTGCLQNIRGALVPCDRLLDEGDAGRIHSVIAGQAGNSVVDFRTGVIALRDADERSVGGAMFIGGRMRRFERGGDGKAFIGDHETAGRRLVKIKGGAHGIVTGRAVVRGIARQLGENPDRWRVGGGQLFTWGGESFNRLLGAILAREFGHGFAATAFSLEGPMGRLALSLGVIREASAKAEAADDLPLKVVAKFANASRFLSELSDHLAREERRRSIPWAPFHRWLDTVEGIDGVSVEAISIR